MNHPLSLRLRRLGRTLYERRGSVILVVLMTTVGLSLIMTPLMQATLTESKMNEKNILNMQARNAAESVIEYGVADLKLRWDNQAGFPANELINHPLSMNTTVMNWLWNGTSVVQSSMNITGGIVPPGQWVYIDPMDPMNQFDPQRGKMVFARDVMVYGRVTTSSKAGGNVTAYATEALQVRDAPLFAHAIFYNMDLEFHPGPAMTITGPVHSNGNLWAVAQTNLTFAGTVTTSKSFNVGMKPWPTDWSSSSESAQTGRVVTLPTSGGGAASPYKGSGSEKVSSSYYDDRTVSFNGTGYSNWREFSANTWGGNLQTSDHGVPSQNVVGYHDYVPDGNGDGNLNDDLNYAYAIIEPNQLDPVGNPYHKGVGENDKYARKAGLIIRTYDPVSSNVTITNGNCTLTIGNNSLITATWTGNVGNATLLTAANTAIANNISALTNGTLSWSNGTANLTTIKPVSHAVLLTTNTTQATTVGGAETTNGMQWTSGNTTKRVAGYSWVSFNKLQRITDPGTGLRTTVYNGTTTMTDAYGNTIYAGDVNELPVTVNATLLTNGGPASFLKFRPAVVGNITGNASNTDRWEGLYDGRRTKDVKTLELDVGKLANLIDDNSASYPAYGNSTVAPAGTKFFNGPAGSGNFSPTDEYNGILYVEFPMTPPDATRLGNVTNAVTGVVNPGDKVRVSEEGWGLVLANATNVPNPNYNNPANYTAAAGRSPGFTVATNNALYTVGNLNADGNINTPSPDTTGNLTYNSTMPDDPAHPRPPVALVADSITILSGNYVAYNSGKGKSGSYNQANYTEVTAALLTGIVPSLKSSATQESGGAHNFPRFLESWSGDTFRYRGSLVALFESEIGNEPWSTSYYDPPTREWGFYNEFALGHYPPGTPNVRSYRRVDFSFLTPAQYTAAIAAIH